MDKYLDGLTEINLKKICQDENIPEHNNLTKKQLIQHIVKCRIKIRIKEGIDKLSSV